MKVDNRAQRLIVALSLAKGRPAELGRQMDIMSLTDQWETWVADMQVMDALVQAFERRHGNREWAWANPKGESHDILLRRHIIATLRNGAQAWEDMNREYASEVDRLSSRD